MFKQGKTARTTARHTHKGWRGMDGLHGRQCLVNSLRKRHRRRLQIVAGSRGKVVNHVHEVDFFSSPPVGGGDLPLQIRGGELQHIRWSDITPHRRA